MHFTLFYTISTITITYQKHVATTAYGLWRNLYYLVTCGFVHFHN